MAGQSMKKQAFLLTGANVIVRALGFIMRIFFSRLMGAETMGIMELASSAHMLVITPATAGMPLAVSRLTAKAGPNEKGLPLQAGKRIVRRLSLVLIPCFLLLSPFIARALGDARTLPALWMSAPCVLILGYSAVYNGYCYGVNNAWPPAASELMEQCIRFVLSLGLLYALPHLSTAWMAAIPSFSTVVAETAGLVLVLNLLRLPKPASPPAPAMEKKVTRLALPPTGMRLCNTGLRSLNAVFIPLRLRASGLAAAEATARFGMLTGMAMPLLMLPSVFTGALGMLATPALAARENSPKKLKTAMWELLLAALFVSLGCMALLYAAAPWISLNLYRMAELAPLIRFLCPTVCLMSLHQVISGMIAGIGRQKHAFYGTLIGAAITLLASWILTGLPSLRLYGAAGAMMLGNLFNVIWNLILLFRAVYLQESGKTRPAA